MNIYPESEIIKAANLYSNSEYDAISFEKKRIKSLLRYLSSKEICFDSITCCQCTATKSLYHYTYNDKDYFVWGENSHPLSKDVHFYYRISS